jgi:cytidine deaminase
MMFEALYRQARSVVRPRKLSDSADAGGVGAALLTASGSVYTGVCIDTACSMGFCAEHAAAAAMITAGENRVVRMVAVNAEGSILPPCGRCREFISQLHPDNLEAEVLVGNDRVATLHELLPHDWRAIARNA